MTVSNKFAKFTVRLHMTLCKGKGKGKGKVDPRTGQEDSDGEYRYSSILSLTSALDGGGWLTPRPDSFTHGKDTPYSLYRRLGGPHGRSGRDDAIYPPNRWKFNAMTFNTPS